MTRRWWGALAATLALHATLWLVLRPAAPSPGAPARSPRTVHLRLTEEPPRPLPEPAPAAPAASASNRPPHPPAPATPPRQLGAHGDEAAAYLPRSALTQGPRPIEPPLLAYPDDAPAGHWRAVFTLFIDAEGQVQRIRSDSADLPAVLEQAARQAFMATRFEPGQVNERAVNARITLEVEFEAQATTRALRRP